MEEREMNTEDTRELLEKIDGYIEHLFGTSDEVLEATLRDSRRGGLPEINVSPNQGRLLRLLVEITGARRILEIGALGGYSAIHLARGLPEDGELISLELDEHHADVARNNVERAGLSRVQPPGGRRPQVARHGAAPHPGAHRRHDDREGRLGRFEYARFIPQ